MANLFESLFAAEPDRPCLHDGERWLSYGDLAARARQLGSVLHDLGLEPGDRLVAQTSKSPDALALWFGCLTTGIVYVPTNTAYTVDEIGYFCDDADATLLVGDDPAVYESVQAHAVALDELVERARSAAEAPIAAVADDTLAALVYTSGTTGRPKGARLTHACLLDNGRALADVWQTRPGDVLLHALPIFHVHGLFIALHPLLLVGGRVRFLPRFDVDAVLVDLTDATVFMGVPTYYHRLLADERFGPTHWSSMRLFTSGSAPMTELVHDEFTSRTGHRIVERYGMSEAGIITSNRIGDEVPGTVGHALPRYEIRIVDDLGGPLEAGTNGVVEVRGPSLGPGYWNRPGADTETRNAEGWFNTGDIGSLDETGRLTLEGRAGDMIISGGLNVYPKEIETALDAVDGVIESAVVGLPDRDLGERVTAFVVLVDGSSLDETAVGAALAPLARFKHPKAIHVVAELPRNAMGKVQKAQLRQI